MTSINVTQQYQIDDEFFGVLADMAYTFGTVWAESFTHQPDSVTFVVSLNEEGRPERDQGRYRLGSNLSNGEDVLFSYDEIGMAISRTIPVVRKDLAEHLSNAIRENDAGEIDAEIADCVLQMACFGKLVFG